MENSIKIADLNLLLSDLSSLASDYYRPAAGIELVEKINLREGVPQDGDGSQGEYNAKVQILKIGDNFFRVEIRTDSYGDNHFIHSIQVAKPTTKTVTAYEKI